MITFKSYEDLEHIAFYYCHVLDCKLEAEKLYATETQIRDVCINHYTELTKQYPIGGIK
jgi:hypothetical protein